MNRVKIVLEEIEQTMEYKFLETASDKSEILDIARKRGLNVPSPDIALFKGIYTTADVFNANGSRLLKDEIIKALDTLVLKPITHNHEEKRIVGIWLDAKIEDDKVIAYGALYRDNFKEEFVQFKKDFESGKLGISYEIYGDKIAVEKDKYDMINLLFCGGAILDRGISPAVKGSRVLEMAKIKDCGNSDSLIACDKCGFKFDISTVKPEETGGTKCPQCKEVVGLNCKTESTNSIPCNCPSCGNRMWDNVVDKGNKIIARCTSCQKSYEFEIEQYNKQMPKIGLNIALEGRANCPQCNNTIKYPIWANREKTPLICKKCGLKFIHTRKESEIKFIVKSIVEVKEEIMNELQKAFANVEKLEDITDEMLKTYESASDEIKVTLSEAIRKLIEDKSKVLVTASTKPLNDVLVNGIKKLALEIMNYREDAKIFAEYERELAEVKETSTKEIAIVTEAKEKDIASLKDSYKEQAKKIYIRKQELGDFAKEMSDEQILDDKDFEIARLKKENKELVNKKEKEIAADKTLEIGSGETPVVPEDTNKKQEEYNKRLEEAVKKEMAKRKK